VRRNRGHGLRKKDEKNQDCSTPSFNNRRSVAAVYGRAGELHCLRRFFDTWAVCELLDQQAAKTPRKMRLPATNIASCHQLSSQKGSSCAEGAAFMLIRWIGRNKQQAGNRHGANSRGSAESLSSSTSRI
jgi:hypothetical protein